MSCKQAKPSEGYPVGDGIRSDTPPSEIIKQHKAKPRTVSKEDVRILYGRIWGSTCRTWTGDIIKWLKDLGIEVKE